MGDGARLARTLDAGVASSCCREVAIVGAAGADGARRADDAGAAWAGVGVADYDRDPRPDRAGGARASRTSTARVASRGGLRAAARAARLADVPDRDRQGQLHGRTSSRRRWCPEGRLLLQTVRSHDQYNTTIYGLDDRYRGIQRGAAGGVREPGRPDELGFADGGHGRPRVGVDGRVRAARGGLPRRAYDTARGCAAAYFPETNVLVPLDSTADGSQHADVEGDRGAVGGGAVVRGVRGGVLRGGRQRSAVAIPRLRKAPSPR